MRKFISIPSILLLLVFACDRVDQVVLPIDQAYFPVRVGAYWIYEVVETTYGAQSQIEDQFELKMSVIDSFRVNTGEVTYLVHRSRKSATETTWKYLDTWSLRINAERLVVSEGTTAFVKLVFPASKGRKWDGNAYNTLGGKQLCDNINCDLYEITETQAIFTTLSAVYDHALVVTQSDDEDPIVGNDIRKEVYLRDVGLVYKRSEVIEYCTQANCVGQKQIIGGIRWEQQLIDYGVE